MKWKSTGKVEKSEIESEKREMSEIEDKKFKALHVISKLASAEENKGEYELFGELIATDLKALKENQK